MKIKELTPNTNATLEEVAVKDKSGVREFTQRNGDKGTVCNLTVSDDSGECQLTLWSGQFDGIEPGDKLKLTDCWVKEWQGNIQVSTGKNGTIEKL